jgi:hypothetical protein
MRPPSVIGHFEGIQNFIPGALTIGHHLFIPGFVNGR